MPGSALWVGVFQERGGPEAQTGALFSLNILDRIGAEWSVGWGEYRSTGTPSEARARLAATLPLGPLTLCPYVEHANQEYAFHDAFDVDRGNFGNEESTAGLGLARALASGSARSLVLRFDLGVTRHRLEMRGRRLVVTEDSVQAEEVHRLDFAYYLTGRVALEAAWRGLAFSLDVGRTPRFQERDLSLTARVGWRAISLER